MNNFLFLVIGFYANAPGALEYGSRASQYGEIQAFHVNRQEVDGSVVNGWNNLIEWKNRQVFRSGCLRDLIWYEAAENGRGGVMMKGEQG